MSKRIAASTLLALLVMILFVSAFNNQILPSAYALTITVPDEYATIQAAIDAANVGDTIYVKDGTYVENVIVNKAITLVGQSMEGTIVNGGGGGSTIRVTASGATVRSLTARNSGSTYPNSGIHLQYVDNTVVQFCDVSYNNGLGIFVEWGTNNVISDNIVTNNMAQGVRIDGQNAPGTIASNTIEYNQQEGIFVYYANGVLIEENTISNNVVHGITVQGESENIRIGHNLIDGNGVVGIELFDSDFCTIVGNQIVGNGQDGLLLWTSCSTIVGNSIMQNAWNAIHIHTCNFNKFYHNNFVENGGTVDGYGSSLGNVWDDGYPSGGNYWSVYADVDADGDGIWDTPLALVADNADLFPLVYPWSSPVHNINTGIGFDTIQSAIDDSETAAGHVLFIENGTYLENVVVSKGLWLLGEDGCGAIVDGGGTGNTIRLAADNIVLENITAVNSGSLDTNSGILLDGVQNVKVTGSNASFNNYYGIFVSWGTDNVVSGNLVTFNSQFGIRVDGENSYATIANNTVEYNQRDGIFLYDAYAVLVENNTLSNNLNSGISPQAGSNNVIIRRNVIASNTWHGIFVGESEYISISENAVTLNVQDGIQLHMSSYCMLEANCIEENGWNGIFLSFSSDNKIWHNNLVDNVGVEAEVDAPDQSLRNVWDDDYPSGGNYWSDYFGVDADNDGIGDTPYAIDEYNQDRYPLWSMVPPFPLVAAFDFGLSSSPIETGYTRVTNLTAYSASTGFGWSSLVELVSRDRGAPDDLRRDLVQGNNTAEHIFSVDLANGDYRITVIMGDQDYGHDLMDVYAEDVLKINDLTTVAGVFQQVTFYVTVADGQLNLRFVDDGGLDPNWAIAALSIQLGSPPPLLTSASFDFGTSNSPVKAGYTRITENTFYSVAAGYGWSGTAGLESRDRTAPSNLNRDLIQSMAEHTFTVDLANGDYEITVVMGDQNYLHDLMAVYAEGVLKIDDLTVAAGTFQEVTFYVTVADEQLNVRILDDGGVDGNWVINSLAVHPGSPPALPTEAWFDFGAAGSPVEAGYAQVTETTLYSASTGYGWTSTTGLLSRDRGAPDSLRRESSPEHN